MEIGKITLKEDELYEAVKAWLESKGLKVEVACVQKALYKARQWEVTSVVEIEPAPSIPVIPPLSAHIASSEGKAPKTCIARNCFNNATESGDPDSRDYYCDQHKTFCAHQDCISRVSKDGDFCPVHTPATKPEEPNPNASVTQSAKEAA